MALAPVSGSSPPAASTGLDFQSLLRIILTQLTYQDPLKPMDNFEFVSQLAQFSQLQQSQTLNDQITSLLAAQAAMQGTTLLGRTVDYTNPAGQTLSGIVKAVSFTSGQPQVSIQTSTGEIISGVAISAISQVR
jgi:flagellar basal-body rod modification protein FlgD